MSRASVHGAYNYYGKYIGALRGYHHSVQGEVYAVDARTLHIRDFTYDGQGPAAYFWAGSSSQPDASGFALRDERQSTTELKAYRKKHVTLTLPEGKSLTQIKWFSIWCESAAVNFGDVRIPKGFDFPRPQKIGQLAGVHGVSSDPIVIVDAQTLLVPNFSYDGEAPDAKFWVGTGPHPSPQGIRVPDENGKEEPLRRYNRKTIVLTLPGELTVFEIGHFGVWCEAFTVDFGHIQIPANVNMPPSLKMLGVSPQTNLVGQNVVNKIIEKVNVLFSIDQSSSSSNVYQQPGPSATNHHYVTSNQQYQPNANPTTIFHSFQQQYHYQFPQQSQNPFIQNQFLQPNIFSQPAYSTNTKKYEEENSQLNTFPRPLPTKNSQEQTFVPSFSTFPSSDQSHLSQNYPFNLQNPQAFLVNQQYEQNNPLLTSQDQTSIYKTQDVQQLISSLPQNPHRLGPVNNHQAKPQSQKKDKVTTYKPPTLDIHRFITKQQTINSNKNKRNDGGNVQIVQSISYDQDQTFEPSEKHEVIIPAPTIISRKSEEINKPDSFSKNVNITKRDTRKNKLIKKEDKTEETETPKDKENPIQHGTPFISDPKIILKQALIYDPISRTYKEESLFYKQNSKGNYERFQSKKQPVQKDEKNENEGRQGKRLNRRIYTEDIDEINEEYNKYLPEVNEKFQDISIENNEQNDDNNSKRYIQNGFLDERYNTHHKYNDNFNGLPNQKNKTKLNSKLYKPHAVNTPFKQYDPTYKTDAKLPNDKVPKNILTDIEEPSYEDPGNVNGDISDALSYKDQAHAKQNRQVNGDVNSQPTQSPKQYSSQNINKVHKPPRVLFEEYFNAKPTEIITEHNFNDEGDGIIHRLPLEKEINFNIPPNPMNNFPETGKSILHYPSYVGGQDRPLSQYYQETKEINGINKYVDKPKVANEDYNEPPTNTDYYDQPQQNDNVYNNQNFQDDDYDPYQEKPQLVLGYKSPNIQNNADSKATKPNKYEPQSQSFKTTPDYYNQYPDVTDGYYEVGKKPLHQKSPKPTTPQYQEQPTPQIYVENSTPAYAENLKLIGERYQQSTVPPVDYYDQPKRQAYYNDPKSQGDKYYNGPHDDLTDDQIKSSPGIYNNHEANDKQPNYQQQALSQLSTEIYSEDPKPNYDYYEKNDDGKLYQENRNNLEKPNNEKVKSLSELYYSQFKTEEEPSATRPTDFLRYEIKDDIIKKYYYANDESRLKAPINQEINTPSVPQKDIKNYFKPESVPYEPLTSTKIATNYNSNNEDKETTPKYHFETQSTPQYDIPASTAINNDILFNVYKQKQLDLQEKNLQIQEKAHKERELEIQKQVYENYKRQLAGSTIPPNAVPHLKTPVNVEITSY
ncbi:hypothetical protein M8J75_002858 [Diaphorina citri]|nr:hypothetical protein M8J75_002858 [Diaphorina citri]